MIGTLILSVHIVLTFSPFVQSLNDAPQMECLEDAMRLHFVPDSFINGTISDPKFYGHVYIKGFFFSSRCHLDFTKSPVDQPFYFHIPYKSDCQVKRERITNQTLAQGDIASGFLYSTVIIVQHHRLFVTERDRAYSVSCFYHEDRNFFQNSLKIGELTPSQVEGVNQLPSCVYEILSAATARPIRFANIGDQLIHRWTCDAENMGMLVHSCSVRDDIGSEFALLDERGCVTDQSLMQPLVYSSSLNKTESPPVGAFKFADQMTVYFTCRITLCDRRENGCEGITPPICDGSTPEIVTPLQLLGKRLGPLSSAPISSTARPSTARTFATMHHFGDIDNTQTSWSLANRHETQLWRNGVHMTDVDANTPAYTLQRRPSASAMGSVSDEWASDSGVNLFSRGRQLPLHNDTRQRRDTPSYFARTMAARGAQTTISSPNITAQPARLIVNVTADRLIIFTNDEKIPSDARIDGALQGKHRCSDAAALWMSAIFVILLAVTVCVFVAMHLRYRREMIHLRRQVLLQHRSTAAMSRSAIAPLPSGYGGASGGFAPPPFFELATMLQTERAAQDHSASRQNLVS